MINPELLCNQHLLGEHSEIHKHRHNFVKKHKISGRIFPIVQIEPLSMQSRHDELHKEMERRFKKTYDSPYQQPDLNHLPINEKNARVDIALSLQDLSCRCEKCREKIQQIVFSD